MLLLLAEGDYAITMTPGNSCSGCAFSHRQMFKLVVSSDGPSLLRTHTQAHRRTKPK
jgi:hypothetical protein